LQKLELMIARDPAAAQQRGGTRKKKEKHTFLHCVLLLRRIILYSYSHIDDVFEKNTFQIKLVIPIAKVRNRQFIYVIEKCRCNRINT
jgi:hypothetical protein